MSTEPTSVLTFEDLILEVARKSRVAYYGADGLGIAQIPINIHDLDECKRHVNNAIRMFISDAPRPNGWHWTRPTGSVTIWGDINIDSINIINTAVYDGSTLTLLTSSQAGFTRSMVGETITIADIGNFVIHSFVSATRINVVGDASAADGASKTWLILGESSPTAANPILTAVYDGVAYTLITITSAAFYESMEEKTFTIADIGDFTINQFVSSTQVYVTGDASTAHADDKTWSILSNGNFTLPRTFGGQYTGVITYTADTNQGVNIEWTSEATIRQWREDIVDENGDPYWAAVRPMAGGTPRRRWELIVYPKPNEIMVVEFPFNLHFDLLVNLTEVQPAPFSHDETIKKACLAVVERDVESFEGLDWSDYRNRCLANSHTIDSQSTPRKLGYFGNPSLSGRSIQFFRNSMYSRPTVPFNS